MTSARLLNLGGKAAVPLIGQNEAQECGLACLAMIAAFHGLSIDLPTLRRKYGISLKGATLQSLMEISDSLGLGARAVRVEIDDLSAIAQPAILHWDLNHFVVLVKVRRSLNGDRFLINDPARGSRWLSEVELSPHFTGVALELSRTDRFAPDNLQQKLKLRQLWTRVSGLKRSLLAVFGLSCILQIVTLAAPYYLQLAVDSALPAIDTDFLKALAIGFGGLALLSFATTLLRSLMLTAIGSSISFQLTSNLARHLLRLPLPWFERRHTGDIVSRFGSTQQVSDLLSQGLIAAIVDGVLCLLTLALMFIYSPLLALIALAAWGLFFAAKKASLQLIQTENISAITKNARESTAFIETLRNIASIKAFGHELERQDRWQALKADAVNAQIKLGRITGSFDAIGSFILALERIIFLYAAVRMAMHGDLTLGMIFAFQSYKQQFMDTATRSVDFFIRLKILDVHLTRISDIALADPEPAFVLSVRDEFVDPPSIEFTNVGFSYGSGDAEVLKAAKFGIHPGEFVAVIGPSGGGKTTFLKVVLGLLTPTYGEVRINGEVLSGARVHAWRQRVGTVFQDDVLFAGTIAENIAFFDPEIDMHRVIEAATAADLHGSIMKTPLRYDTLVGDMGTSLSGGQRQRVLIARALYRSPCLLLLDEGTAHLDPASEDRVINTVQSLRMTRVLIAHRQASIAAADRVLMIANGNIIPVPKDLAGSLLAPKTEATKETNVDTGTGETEKVA
jgi:ATP-binding cassette subfamily B protein RaxB